MRVPKGYLKPAYLENGDDQEAMEREEKKKKLEAKLAADAKRKEEEAKKVREEKKRELEQKAEQKKARKEELKQREALGLPRSSKPRAETTAWTEVGGGSSSSAAGGSSSSYPYTGGGYAASSSLPWQSDGGDYGFQFPLPPPPSFSGAAASSSMHGGGLPPPPPMPQPPRPPPPEFNLERQQSAFPELGGGTSSVISPASSSGAGGKNELADNVPADSLEVCAVCLEPLAGVRLECSHTFCGGCLKDWASVLTSYAATARKGSSAVTCPICRQSTEVAHKIAQSSPPVQFAYTPAQQLGGGGAPRAHVPAHAPPSTAAAVAARRAGASSSSSSSAAGAPAAAASGWPRVRHITGQRAKVLTVLEMPHPDQRWVSALIGRKGATIQAISHESGCQVHIQTAATIEPNATVRTIELMGTPGQRGIAEDLIRKKLASERISVSTGTCGEWRRRHKSRAGRPAEQPASREARGCGAIACDVERADATVPAGIRRVRRRRGGGF